MNFVLELCSANATKCGLLSAAVADSGVCIYMNRTHAVFADILELTRSVQGVDPSVRLAPGQEASIHISFGRKNNIVGSIAVSRRVFAIMG